MQKPCTFTNTFLSPITLFYRRNSNENSSSAFHSGRVSGHRHLQPMTAWKWTRMSRSTHAQHHFDRTSGEGRIHPGWTTVSTTGVISSVVVPSIGGLLSGAILAIGPMAYKRNYTYFRIRITPGICHWMNWVSDGIRVILDTTFKNELVHIFWKHIFVFRWTIHGLITWQVTNVKIHRN